MPSQTYLDSLKRYADIHIKKNADYAQDTNPYSNFEYAAQVAEIFKDPVDKVFATMIGIKLARIGALTSQNRVPNNESLIDSFDDMTIYAGMWGAYRSETKAPNEAP